MGVLNGVLSLAREPVRLTLRVWEFGLASAASAARLGLDLLEPERSTPAAESYPAPPRTRARGNGGAPTDSAPPGPASPRRAQQAPRRAPDAPPAVPDELIPDHVDEEVVLVAEVAEEGAEDGAGPELHIDEPWEGYDRMSAVEVRDRLSGATVELAAAVELYEATRKGRRTVLEAAERALRR